MVVEIVVYYCLCGLIFVDGIDEIYKEYGYFVEKMILVIFLGVDGVVEIKKIMDKFCENGLK